MKNLGKLGLVVLLMQVNACQQGASENIRGKVQLSAGDEGNGAQGTGDATVDGNTDPATANQQAVVVDSGNIQPLKLKAEADQTALPAGFMDDVFALHKISADKTILFGKSKQAFLLDETKAGSLSKLTVDISPPAGTTLYILENKNFWLVGKSSVAFPSIVPSTDPGQLTLINLSPDLLKDPANATRVLFAGPQRLILANEKRANIIVLEGDKARVIGLDFPKIGDVPLPVFSAGLMDTADAYWFLSKDRLLLLKKGNDNIWRWFISKFILDAQGLPPDAPLNQVAMIINQGEDKGVNYIGRTFELAAGKIFEQNAIKLSVDNTPNPALDPAFVNEVQPLLKTACVPCHAGYEEYATVKAKAAVFKQMITDGTMPKGTVLTPEQIKLLTDYMTKLLTP